jgi:hypothetical protein
LSAMLLILALPNSHCCGTGRPDLTCARRLREPRALLLLTWLQVANRGRRTASHMFQLPYGQTSNRCRGSCLIRRDASSTHNADLLIGPTIAPAILACELTRPKIAGMRGDIRSNVMQQVIRASRHRGGLY